MRRSQIADRLAAIGLPALPDPLAAPIADSHTHLDTVCEMVGVDPELSLAAAAATGVTRLVEVGCDVAGSRFAEHLASRHRQVVAAVAIHPDEAAELAARSPEALTDAIEEIDRLAGSGSHVRAVGETGIDHHNTPEGPGWAVQRDSFAAHIALAKKHGLTLAVHDRQGHRDILDVLDAEGWPDRVIMHCFSAGADHARRCLEHGAWLSFSGTVTFKSARPQREALAITPHDRILVETDAPFLTAEPLRGRRNGPYLVAHTARFIGDRLGLDELDCCRMLDRNSSAAYGGEWGTDHD
ncbi:TatD family hydrolase [Acidipropionibacterium jensenii]|uniref:TatD family hydrolase n=1 Tax=Acidipropionibacterium jensenii TaxID=1749 RepID=UPI000BC2EB66|nr:TatD family hydrolase [Acidipropionibacterium jensenii]MDN5976897.1 TatD family hydrolase [Acidipropionibacterium jensenii]MDN5996333.1 TatD family hydrolase [Acidipropionibacterium jensenii]MDN6441817.1 TatD family hydrolase [Acidipropionibacterium jensenii]MDN6480014.1 TatD family hydrolase [Acidipropionibacterium jensenii]MDN6511776.1 TatD family hydrolase [Acidipropionibacterium jensenii]